MAVVTSKFHLAQANIARMRAPLEDPLMEGFAARLEPLNALADSSPGFVWRLQTEEGDATSVRAFEDELILFNLSVWESIEALEAYVYRSNHVAAVQQRAEWFERPTKSPLVLWWIDAGHIPTETEAQKRFELLWQNGPTPAAFTFRTRFDADT
ncbi:MAG: DUF3291 domain-containing protein [Gammaproteobacteria bacterium]|nr:DUF3291 domain-containing protein [Gammaproteobacteria bacterium]